MKKAAKNGLWFGVVEYGRAVGMQMRLESGQLVHLKVYSRKPKHLNSFSMMLTMRRALKEKYGE